MEKNNKKRITKYTGVYNDLAMLLGEESAEKIYAAMAGQQITFPRKLYTREYVIEETRNITDQAELKKVAIHYGYTERRLKQILKQAREESNK